MPPAMPFVAVQRALYERLIGDAQLVAALAPSATGAAGVYDQPLPNAKFPRLELGGFTGTPSNLLGPYDTQKWGCRITGQVKVLSTYPGDAEAMTIAGHVLRLLAHPERRLVIAGFADVECWISAQGPVYTELLGSVIVRHLPTIVEVELHEV